MTTNPPSREDSREALARYRWHAGVPLAVGLVGLAVAIYLVQRIHPYRRIEDWDDRFFGLSIAFILWGLIVLAYARRMRRYIARFGWRPFRATTGLSTSWIVRGQPLIKLSDGKNKYLITTTAGRWRIGSLLSAPSSTFWFAGDPAKKGVLSPTSDLERLYWAYRIRPGWLRRYYVTHVEATPDDPV